MLDARWLRTLVAVVEHRSFGAAAHRRRPRPWRVPRPPRHAHGRARRRRPRSAPRVTTV